MMEKQSGRKIKELHISNVEKYKNQLLQINQNSGIGTHFTNVLHGLAKEINCSLLEKVRCLLSNARFSLRRLCMLVIS